MVTIDTNCWCVIRNGNGNTNVVMVFDNRQDAVDFKQRYKTYNPGEHVYVDIATFRRKNGNSQGN